MPDLAAAVRVSDFALEPYRMVTAARSAAGAGADWFGPLAPMAPLAPPAVAGRQFDYPPGYNLIARPRAYEPIGFPELRALADAYDLVRVIIETRKDQLARLDWAVRPRTGAVARDPRDVLTSAWHFFHKPAAGEDETAAKFAFIRQALLSLDQGARVIIHLAARYPADVMTITYEKLRRTPELQVSNMFRFLSVSDASAVVADCVASTAFVAQTAGRPAGVAQDGAFLRNGIAGDWRSTLTPAMNELILSVLGWMFPHFDWQP